jgi:serine/threonine-protein kinase
VLDLGEEQGAPYVVMELPEGHSLRGLIDAGEPRPLDWCIDLVSQLCEALMHAHRHGVPQLGLRPAGTFVSDDGHVTVVPFGTIPIHGAGGTLAALTLDDVAYLAPELVGGRASDGRADLFTLGVVAYELLVGRRPFQAASVPLLLLALAHEQPDLGLLPRDRRFRGLEALVARALARDPEARYQDAEALLLELEGLACEATTPVPPAAGPPADPELDVLRAEALAHAVADRAAQALGLLEQLEQRAPGDPRNEELRAYLRTEGAAQNGEALLEVGRHQLAMGNFVTARAAALGALSVRPCRTRARTLLLDVEGRRQAFRPRPGTSC